MVKYVIAGRSDCPFFARTELLADELQLRLPEFAVHKIVVTPQEWSSWVEQTCDEKGWCYGGDSPLIWRELINRGGKGILIGSSDEFLEIAKGYYGITIDKDTPELVQIARENEKSKTVFDKQEQNRTVCGNPYRITVVGADSDLAYSVIPLLPCEALSKKVKDVYLTLHTQTQTEEIEGLAMELMDCAHPELRNITVTQNIEEALTGADLVIIINTLEVDKESVNVLKSYGCALNRIKMDTKVFFAGKQPILACNVALAFADKVNKENVFALSRIQESHIKAAIAKKLLVNTPNIHKVVIWGSSFEFILDISKATVSQYDGAVWAPHVKSFTHDVNEMVYEKDWLWEELPRLLVKYKQGGPSDMETLPALDSLGISGDMPTNSLKSNLSEGAALISQINDILDNVTGDIFSMGVVSTGHFGIPPGLVFSVPCMCSFSKIFVVKEFELGEEMGRRIIDLATQMKEFCSQLTAVS